MTLKNLPWESKTAMQAAVVAFLSYIADKLANAALEQVTKGIIDQLAGNLLELLIAAGFAVIIFLIVRKLLKPRPKDMVPPQDKPNRAEGLILLVGTGLQDQPPEKQSARIAIEYHFKDSEGQRVLRACWLIASEQSYDYAVKLKEEFAPKGIAVNIEKIYRPFYDINETYETVVTIYGKKLREFALSDDDVVADFTGGTKPMSLGMAMACLPFDRAMQYMTGRKEDVASVPTIIKFAPYAA